MFTFKKNQNKNIVKHLINKRNKAMRKLYSWGANSWSQLGLNKKTEYELPTEVCLPNITIKKISAGARHTIILDSLGDLYITGKTDFSTDGYEGTFKRINLTDKFRDVICGFDTTAAFTENNKLLVWGNNKSRQLGFANVQTIKEPLELSLPNNETPIDVKFGLKHTAIYTKSRRIFIVGLLKPFKLEKNASFINHNSIEWLELSNIDNISHFSCGQNHVSFVIDMKESHGLGDNKFGQCSQTKATEKITKIESGWTHNGFITESKYLWLFGRNNYGQLGLGHTDLTGITEPQKSPINSVNDFALGAEHGILSSNKEIYTWGWNEHRNCGFDTDQDILEPKRLFLCNNVCEIDAVIAGAGFCMVLLQTCDGI